MLHCDDECFLLEIHCCHGNQLIIKTNSTKTEKLNRLKLMFDKTMRAT